jgi:hypothetical protein
MTLLTAMMLVHLVDRHTAREENEASRYLYVIVHCVLDGNRRRLLSI